MREPPTSTDETAATGFARLTVAAPAFVNDLFVPFLSLGPGRTIRAIALVPGLLPPLDAVVTVGDETDAPAGWSRLPVGEVAYTLFASPAIARSLDAAPHAGDVEDLPYVTLVSEDDRCPLPREDRWVTHEVETFALACRVAAAVDRLVYAPVLAAAPFVRDGSLVELPIAGWSRSSPLHLATPSNDRGSRMAEEIERALRLSLGKSVATSTVVASGSPFLDHDFLGDRRRIQHA